MWVRLVCRRCGVCVFVHDRRAVARIGVGVATIGQPAVGVPAGELRRQSERRQHHHHERRRGEPDDVRPGELDSSETRARDQRRDRDHNGGFEPSAQRVGERDGLHLTGTGPDRHANRARHNPHRDQRRVEKCPETVNRPIRPEQHRQRPRHLQPPDRHEENTVQPRLRKMVRADGEMNARRAQRQRRQRERQHARRSEPQRL